MTKWNMDKLADAFYARLKGKNWIDIGHALTGEYPLTDEGRKKLIQRVESAVYKVMSNCNAMGTKLHSYIFAAEKQIPIRRDSKFTPNEFTYIGIWLRETERQNKGEREIKPGDDKPTIKMKKRFRHGTLRLEQFAELIGRTTDEVTNYIHHNLQALKREGDRVEKCAESAQPSKPVSSCNVSDWDDFEDPDVPSTSPASSPPPTSQLRYRALLIAAIKGRWKDGEVLEECTLTDLENIDRAFK